MGDSLIPFELVLFLVLAVIMGFILAQDDLRPSALCYRQLEIGCPFCGNLCGPCKVQSISHSTDYSAGIAAILLTSRIGSTRPNIALNWDIETITLVVLGGVSIMGGRGTVPGVTVAIFLLGYLKFGMGLLNISAKIMIITTGVLLIIAVLLPNFLDLIKAKRKLRMQQVRQS